MANILNLFPDTNLFIQCFPLDQLAWEQWNNFDEIHLIVSRPIQKEIDKHKNSGSDRRAKRARNAASLMREVITGSANHKVIKDSGPTVKLFIRLDIKLSDALADKLNYDEPDDQLVGTVASFVEQNLAREKSFSSLVDFLHFHHSQGQNATWAYLQAMSGVGPISHIGWHGCFVCSVPIKFKH